MNILNINVFESSSNEKTVKLNLINKNSYEEQIDFPFYGDQFCLKSNLHKFCTSNESFTHFSRWCSNTKFENHMLGCIEQEGCNVSYLHPNP